MRSYIALVIAAIALALSGCVLSLHPLYTDETAVFDPALVGTWRGDDGEDTWYFRREGDTLYSLVYTTDGKPGEFDARLVKLGEFHFLDLFPEAPNVDANNFYKFHLLPAHSFLKVSIDGDVLRMSLMDEGNRWLKHAIRNGDVDIKHEQPYDGDDIILLTAPTNELQAFVLKLAENKDAFGEPGVLRRVVEDDEQPDE